MSPSAFHRSLVICLIAMAGLVGCKKEPAASAGGTGATRAAATAPASAPTSAPARAPEAASLIGNWGVTDAPGHADMPREMVEEMMTSIIRLFPNRTFRFRDRHRSWSGGTWSLEGFVLTLKPPPWEGEFGHPMTFNVDGRKLIDTSWINAVFERLPASYGEPEYRLSAAAYMAEIRTDIRAPQAKYAGKIIELDGFISNDEVIDYLPAIRVSGEPDKVDGFFSHNPIECLTVDPEPFVRVSPGQKVKIRGEVVSSSGGALKMIEVEILETGPSTAINLTAAHLAAEFQKDPNATAEKYQWTYSDGKQLTVTGPLRSIEFGDLGRVALLLGTDDAKVFVGLEVHVGSEEWMAKKAQALKPGGVVTVIGYYDTRTPDKRFAKLTAGHIVGSP